MQRKILIVTYIHIIKVILFNFCDTQESKHILCMHIIYLHPYPISNIPRGDMIINFFKKHVWECALYSWLDFCSMCVDDGYENLFDASN
jgi:hypothetical protein